MSHAQDTGATRFAAAMRLYGAGSTLEHREAIGRTLWAAAGERLGRA